MSELSKLYLIILLFLSINAFSQEYSRFMFYNTENLFDIYNDSIKNDDEFTPDGDKHWNKFKYNEKLNHIYKVITAVGGWKSPDFVGFCEVENRLVLEELLKFTPLNKLNYEIVHFESPDKRGIDVALLFNANNFYLVESKPVPVVIDGRPTRDILYAKFNSKKDDTLHIFINHWPSRWGGQINSEPRRMAAAEKLRTVVDSLFQVEKNPNIIIAGDLNDFPEDKSVTKILKAHHNFENIQNEELYNISYYLQEKQGQWSHKYQEESGILDQIIISGNLFNNKKFYTTLANAAVFSAPFLLEKDEATFGVKTFRTYIGFKYNGGFSDHLPVYIDFFYQ